MHCCSDSSQQSCILLYLSGCNASDHVITINCFETAQKQHRVQAIQVQAIYDDQNSLKQAYKIAFYVVGCRVRVCINIDNLVLVNRTTGMACEIITFDSVI